MINDKGLLDNNPNFPLITQLGNSRHSYSPEDVALWARLTPLCMADIEEMVERVLRRVLSERDDEQSAREELRQSKRIGRK